MYIYYYYYYYYYYSYHKIYSTSRAMRTLSIDIKKWSITFVLFNNVITYKLCFMQILFYCNFLRFSKND